MGYASPQSIIHKISWEENDSISNNVYSLCVALTHVKKHADTGQSLPVAQHTGQFEVE
jgi:hypothetical protein